MKNRAMMTTKMSKLTASVVLNESVEALRADPMLGSLLLKSLTPIALSVNAIC